MKTQLRLAVGAAFIGLLSGPAHALSVQTVSAGAFQTLGSAGSTAPLSFAPFTAGPASWLSGVKLRVVNGAFSQQIFLSKNNTGPSGRQMTINALPTFNFGSTPATISGTTAQAVVATPNTVTGSGPQSVTATASGAWTTPFSSLSTNTNTLRNYFAGTPSISSYSTSYSLASCINTTTSTTAGNCTFAVDDDPTEPFMNPTLFSGTLMVDYEYEIPPAATPGPIPILGAGAAFAASRRLRRRIQPKIAA
jgi:hypothetical protein